MSPGDHVDAGGDHGCSVNERGDGRGAFHGVGQPDVKRKLRALAGSADQKAQTDDGENSAVPCRLERESDRDSAEVERAEGGEHEEDSNEKSEIADAVDDEGFFTGSSSGTALKIKADEK